MRTQTAVGVGLMFLLAMSAGCGSSGDDSTAPETPGAGGTDGSVGSGGADAGTGGTPDASTSDGAAGVEAAAGNASPDAGTGGAPADGSPPADAGAGGAPADATDAHADTASEASADGQTEKEAASDAGEAAPAAGLGCQTTLRVGFTSETDWPTVAACGSPTGYAEAVAGAAASCANGWHMCTLSDVNDLVGYPPDFIVPTGGASDIGGWLEYTDSATDNFAQYYVACGGTLWKTADLQGTGPCSVSSNYPDGYRLRVSRGTWGGTHQTSLGCMSHADHACGYPGGTEPLAPQYTLCCQDN